MRFLAFAATASLSGLFLLDLCNWLFACGCRNWLFGAVEQCNIHQHQGPHCPWCTMGVTGFWSLFAGMVAVQGVVLWLPGRLPLWLRAAMALASFPLLGLVTRWVL